eukprot:TRINITY_DN15064_c0_g1_i1.p1 TRINITY_DN15064_c0_g1~~TRINITY_DN15064_c0_g1_i1.p1  ORF type:complete len:252 (+),score=46.48 TRINITY_DN15064_c0_g1_i1:105-860(+)
MALAPLNFVDYGKKGKHFQQPTHSFSSAKIRPSLEMQETPRTKEKYDRAWKQKWEALHGRGHPEAIPKRVDWADVAHIARPAEKWAQPNSSRATSTQVTPGRDVPPPSSGSPVGTLKLTGVAKSSIRGFCPTQPPVSDRKVLRQTMSGDATGGFFSATCNRQYGDNLSTLGQSSSETYLHIKPSKLAGGKCLRPPTSNSAYGYFTQLKVHQMGSRKRPMCNETAFVQNMVANNIPYSQDIRFVGQEHHEAI